MAFQGPPRIADLGYVQAHIHVELSKDVNGFHDVR
jgi:hypothetical protein